MKFATLDVMQQQLFALTIPPFKEQLLKWVGNKQRQAHEIAHFFPKTFGTYIEPFLGSGAVLATLAPPRAVGSDSYAPLIEIFQKLRQDPEGLKHWYLERYKLITQLGKEAAYEQVLHHFNTEGANGADFVFLSRLCYGGVVRFRKKDGYMSTPCGAHQAMPPEKFAARVNEWKRRTTGAQFFHQDYRESFSLARRGDLVYCDPPYFHSQTILYGAQDFSVEELFEEVSRLKARGVYVAVSLDGSKKSSETALTLPIPEGLFERVAYIELGSSMLRRFQSEGFKMVDEDVRDRLLLTYQP